MISRSYTKIICTIGPSSDDIDVLEQMYLKGMAVARLNMSHGTINTHLNVIEKIRKIEKKYNDKIFIALDTRGPETRIRCNAVMKVYEDNIVNIYPLKKINECDNSIFVDLESFSFIKEGEIIKIDDSKLILKVKSVSDDQVITVATNAHILKSGKRIYFENSSKIGFLSSNDKNDIKFAIKTNIDAIFLSFVETSQNITDVRGFIGEHPLLLFSKIESKKALLNLSSISEHSDGLMVARGDLMNGVGADQLFSSQKTVSNLSKRMPVIMATEMLQSMSNSETPYRSEISDIGNAVLDGCCAVMLSSETAIGKYPVLCVDIMRKVCLDAEDYIKKMTPETSNNKMNISMFKE